MIKILLIDHYELISRGIEALLNSVEDIEVMGVCDSSQQALAIANNQAPDIILLDINIPRTTRVGNSIIQSNVRVEKAQDNHQLYESVVCLMK